MRMPTRYRRDDTHSTSHTLRAIRAIETPNCHNGGISDPIRSIMMMGAVAGKSEAPIDQMELGSLITSQMSAKLSQMGRAASGVYICSSCSVSHEAARPANSEA